MTRLPQHDVTEPEGVWQRRLMVSVGVPRHAPVVFPLAGPMPSRPVHVLRGTVCRAHVLCLCQSHAKPVPHSMYTTDRIHITSTSLPPLPAWRPWTSTPTSTPSASLEDQVNKFIKGKTEFKLQHSLQQQGEEVQSTAHIQWCSFIRIA